MHILVYKSELASPMQCIEPTICLTRPSFRAMRRFTSLSRASFIHQCWQTSLASETLIYTPKEIFKHFLSSWSLEWKKNNHSNTIYHTDHLEEATKKNSNTALSIPFLLSPTHILWRKFCSGQNSNCSWTSRGNM